MLKRWGRCCHTNVPMFLVGCMRYSTVMGARQFVHYIGALQRPSCGRTVQYDEILCFCVVYRIVSCIICGALGFHGLDTLFYVL